MTPYEILLNTSHELAKWGVHEMEIRSESLFNALQPDILKHCIYVGDPKLRDIPVLKVTLNFPGMEIKILKARNEVELESMPSQNDFGPKAS